MEHTHIAENVRDDEKVEKIDTEDQEKEKEPTAEAAVVKRWYDSVNICIHVYRQVNDKIQAERKRTKRICWSLYEFVSCQNNYQCSVRKIYTHQKEKEKEKKLSHSHSTHQTAIIFYIT